MNKKIREAVRVFIIKDDQVVGIRYKEHVNGFSNYYDIPGGKIEEGETAVDAALREVREEVTLEVNKPIYRGKMTIEYDDRIYHLSVFLATEYSGTIADTIDNYSEWIPIKDIIHKDLKLNTMIVLDSFFRGVLFDLTKTFSIVIVNNNDHRIISMDYKTKDL